MKVIKNLRYTSWKKVEFDKLSKKVRGKLKTKAIEEAAYPEIAKNIAKYIKEKSELELVLLPKFSSDRIDSISSDLSKGGSVAAINQMRIVLKESVGSLLDLGVKHTIADMLHTMPKVKKSFSKKSAKFSSLVGDMTSFVLDGAVAEFNEYDDLNAKDKKDITKSDAYLVRMAESLDKLEERGYFDDFPDKQSRLTRQSYEERYRYLYLITEINNFKKRAEASRNGFVSDEYIKRRHGVLANDFGSSYDNYIKSKIADFIQEESRYMTNIKKKDQGIDKLTDQIRIKLQQRDVDRLKNRLTKSKLQETIAKRQALYESRAEMFIATETSTAYNFGKLLGFSGLEDSNKKFTWNADWELETRNSTGDYEVCKACAEMDGSTYVLSELLVTGTQLDEGAGGYGKNGNKTDFKNPSLPQIPFHPHCNCYWTYEPDLSNVELEADEETAPVDTIDEQELQSPPGSAGSVLATAAGVGLLVGGAFLLSRSNYWGAFIRNTSLKNYGTTGGALSKIVLDTSEYIVDEFDDDVSNSVLQTLLEQLRNLLNRGRK
jgi:hypothetical protein